MYHVHTYDFCRLWKRSNKNNHSGLCKTIDLLLIVCHSSFNYIPYNEGRKFSQTACIMVNGNTE